MIENYMLEDEVLGDVAGGDLGLGMGSDAGNVIKMISGG